jgi:hypothetical protein
MTLRNKLVAPALDTGGMTFKPATPVDGSGKDLSSLARMAERRIAREEAEAQRRFDRQQREEEREFNRQQRILDREANKEAVADSKLNKFGVVDRMATEIWDVASWDRSYNAALEAGDYQAVQDVKRKASQLYRQKQLEMINEKYGAGSRAALIFQQSYLEPALNKFMSGDSMPPDFAGRARSAPSVRPDPVTTSTGTGLRSPAKRGSADSGNGPKFLLGAASYLPDSFADAVENIKDIGVGAGSLYVKGGAALEDAVGTAYEFIEGAVTEASAYRAAYRGAREQGKSPDAAVAAGKTAALKAKTSRRVSGEDRDNFLLEDARDARDDALRIQTNMSAEGRAVMEKVARGDTGDFLEAFAESPVLVTTSILAEMAPSAFVGGATVKGLQALRAGAKMMTTGFIAPYVAVAAGQTTQESQFELSQISDADFKRQPAFLEAKEMLGAGASDADARTLAEQWLIRKGVAISAAGTAAGMLIGGLTERAASRVFQNALKVGGSGGAKGALVSAGREAVGEAIEGASGSVASDVGAGRDVNVARAADSALKGAVIGGALGGAINAGSQLRNRTKSNPDAPVDTPPDTPITQADITQAESDLAVISDTVAQQRSEMADILDERDTTARATLDADAVEAAVQQKVTTEGPEAYTAQALADESLGKQAVDTAADTAQTIDPNTADITVDAENGFVPVTLQGTRVVGETTRILRDYYGRQQTQLGAQFSRRGSTDADIPNRVTAMAARLMAKGFDSGVANMVAGEIAPAARKEVPFYADRASEIGPEYAAAAKEVEKDLVELRHVERQRMKLGEFRNTMKKGRGISGQAFLPEQDQFDLARAQNTAAIADLRARGVEVKNVRDVEKGFAPSKTAEQMFNGGALAIAAKRQAMRSGDTPATGDAPKGGSIRTQAEVDLERIRQRAVSGALTPVQSIQSWWAQARLGTAALDYSYKLNVVDDLVQAKTGKELGLKITYEDVQSRVRTDRALLDERYALPVWDEMKIIADNHGKSPQEVGIMLASLASARRSQHLIDLWPLWRANLLNDTARAQFMSVESDGRKGIIDTNTMQAQLLAIGNDPANYTNANSYVPLDQRSYLGKTRAEHTAVIDSFSGQDFTDDLLNLEDTLQVAFQGAENMTLANRFGGDELGRVYASRSVGGYYYPMKTDPAFEDAADKDSGDINFRNVGRTSIDGRDRGLEDIDTLRSPMDALRVTLDRAAKTTEQRFFRRLATAIQELDAIGEGNIGVVTPIVRRADPKTGKVFLDGGARATDVDAYDVWGEDGLTAGKITITDPMVADLLRSRTPESVESGWQKFSDAFGMGTHVVSRAFVNVWTFGPAEMVRNALHGMATALNNTEGGKFSGKAFYTAGSQYIQGTVGAVRSNPTLYKFWGATVAEKEKLRAKMGETKTGKYALEWYDMAGQTTFNDQIRTDQLRSAAKLDGVDAKDPLIERFGAGVAGVLAGGKWLKNLNDNLMTDIDLTFRLSTYIALREQGASVEKASAAARGMFNYQQQIGRPGGKTEMVVRNVNNFFPFFRASILGVDKVVNRDIFKGGQKKFNYTSDGEGGTIASTQVRNSEAGWLGNLSAAQTVAPMLAGLAAAGLFNDDEELAKHPAERLLKGMALTAGDQAAIFQQQFGVNQIFSGLGVAVALAMRGTHAPDEIARGMAKVFKDNALPMGGIATEMLVPSEKVIDAPANSSYWPSFIATLTPALFEPAVTLPTGVKANGFAQPGVDYAASEGNAFATYSDTAPFKANATYRWLQESTNIPVAVWQEAIARYGGAPFKMAEKIADAATRYNEDPAFSPDDAWYAAMGRGSPYVLGAGSDATGFWDQKAGAISSVMYDLKDARSLAESRRKDGDDNAVPAFDAAYPDYKAFAVTGKAYATTKRALQDRIEALQKEGTTDEEAAEVKGLRSQLRQRQEEFVKQVSKDFPRYAPSAAEWVTTLDE